MIGKNVSHYILWQVTKDILKGTVLGKQQKIYGLLNNDGETFKDVEFS